MLALMFQLICLSSLDSKSCDMGDRRAHTIAAQQASLQHLIRVIGSCPIDSPASLYVGGLDPCMCTGFYAAALVQYVKAGATDLANRERKYFLTSG